MKTPALVANGSNASPHYHSLAPHVGASDLGMKRAFTLIELLSVVAIIGVLAGLLSPALSKAKTTAQTARCLSNLKQFTLAWTMYYQDHDDRIVPNAPWGQGQSWVNGSLDYRYPRYRDNTNEVYLHDSKLSPYLDAASPAIWRCPSDKDRPSPIVKDAGVVRRVRSISMNGWLNSGLDWDTWNCGYVPPEPSKMILKTSDMVKPSPADTFVFLDERYESLDDGAFALTMMTTRWTGVFLGYPGIYHNKAGSFSFADGHVAPKQWNDPRTRPEVVESLSAASPNNPDLAWLQAHATGLKK